MAYTNIELVKQHLLSVERTLAIIRDHRVIFSDSGTVDLPHSTIKKNSEVVSGLQSNKPRSEHVTFDDDVKALSSQHLLHESVVIASDDSLGKVYIENADYVVDYPAGSVCRVSDGDIETGASVTVWYVPCAVYDRNADYYISYENGTVTRIDGGRIQPGQIAFIDYEIEAGVFSDDAISRAINEASIQLSILVDDQKAEAASKELTVAETYLVVAILTQIRALEAAQSSTLTSSGRSSVSSGLLQLSNRYRDDFRQLVRPYVKRQASLSGPHSSRQGR